MPHMQCVTELLQIKCLFWSDTINGTITNLFSMNHEAWHFARLQQLQLTKCGVDNLRRLVSSSAERNIPFTSFRMFRIDSVVCAERVYQFSASIIQSVLSIINHHPLQHRSLIAYCGRHRVRWAGTTRGGMWRAISLIFHSILFTFSRASRCRQRSPYYCLRVVFIASVSFTRNVNRSSRR